MKIICTEKEKKFLQIATEKLECDYCPFDATNLCAFEESTCDLKDSIFEIEEE